MDTITGSITESITERAARVIALVREKTPLVDCITNYVTVNDCANALLAFGASPAMIDARDDAFAFARISGALYLNLGTCLQEQEAAAFEAALGAAEAGVPLVIDPVGCGAIPRRGELARSLARNGRAAIIKGNAGEILALTGKEGGARGVDSAGAEPGAEEACAEAARLFSCAVCATGKIDIICGGGRAVRIANGTPLLTKITGAGCMAGALCAACAAVSPGDPLAAAAAAIAAMGIAGELAAEKTSLPGSFRAALIDSLALITPALIRERGRFR